MSPTTVLLSVPPLRKAPSSLAEYPLMARPTPSAVTRSIVAEASARLTRRSSYSRSQYASAAAEPARTRTMCPGARRSTPRKMDVGAGTKEKFK